MIHTEEYYQQGVYCSEKTLAGVSWTVKQLWSRPLGNEFFSGWVRSSDLVPSVSRAFLCASQTMKWFSLSQLDKYNNFLLRYRCTWIENQGSFLNVQYVPLLTMLENVFPIYISHCLYLQLNRMKIIFKLFTQVILNSLYSAPVDLFHNLIGSHFAIIKSLCLNLYPSCHSNGYGLRMMKYCKLWSW